MVAAEVQVLVTAMHHVSAAALVASDQLCLFGVAYRRPPWLTRLAYRITGVPQ